MFVWKSYQEDRTRTNEQNEYTYEGRPWNKTRKRTAQQCLNSDIASNTEHEEIPDSDESSWECGCETRETLT